MRHAWRAAGLLLCIVGSACTGDGPAPAEPVPLTGTLPPRPSERACDFDGHPPGVLPELELVPMTTTLPLEAPIAMVPAPDGSGDALLLERDGRVWRVAPSDDDALDGTVLFTPNASVERALAISTSPHHSGHLVMTWQTVAGTVRVVRLDYPASGATDPASEVAIVSSIRATSAATTFDDEGLLYVAFSDSTSDAEESVDAQDPASLEGTVSRIDIADLDGLGSYAVPPDNPPATSLGGEGGVSRAWATGVRSPAACTFARGAAWCADRGVDVSEVHHVARAGDLGWPDHDGAACLSTVGCALELDRYPQDAVARAGQNCGLTGIARYAGARFPSLQDALIYADSCTDQLSVMLLDAPDRQLWSDPLVTSEHKVSGVGHDAAGEVYAFTESPGGMVRVVANNERASFPTRLSESGCFADLATLDPNPGVVPYELNAPLWSDGSFKQRWIEVPPDETITVAEGDGLWSFPEGTVVIKSFGYPQGGSEEPTPVEIRVMIARAHGWEFHSYRWDDALGDAVLLDEGDERAIEVTDEGPLTHGFPSRFSCTVCHRVDGIRVLGVRTSQLNRLVDLADGPNHQLSAMEDIGLFSGPSPSPSVELPALADPADESAAIADRARAYLHSNCAHCHQPGGWVPPNLEMDLRYDVPLASTRTCNEATSSGTPGFIIIPGDAAGSRIFERMATRESRQMPPLATKWVDPTGLSVVERWIAELSDCP